MYCKRPYGLVGALLGSVIFGLFGMSPAWAADDLSGYVADNTERIPFLAQGSSATVNGVLITATVNTAVQGDSANSYLHQSNSRRSTTLTFTPAIPGFKAQTRAHADAPGAGWEKYTFVGKDAAGQQVFTSEIYDADLSLSYGPGAAIGPVTGLIKTLEIDYTFDTPVADFARGSYLDLWITDTYLSTTPQVTGLVGSAITPTAAITPTGLAGVVTYSISQGTLPAGLSLNPATGVISGTPTEPFSGSVTISGSGASFGSAQTTVTFTFTAPPPPPTPMLPLGPVEILGTPNAGKVLTCKPPVFDPEATSMRLTWFIDGVQQESSTVAASPFTDDFLIPSGTPADAKVTCEVLASSPGKTSSISAQTKVLPTTINNGGGSTSSSGNSSSGNSTSSECTLDGSGKLAVSFAPMRASLNAAALQAVGTTGSDCIGTYVVTGHVQPSASTANDRQLSLSRARSLAAELKRQHPRASFVIRALGTAKGKPCPVLARNRCAVVESR